VRSTSTSEPRIALCLSGGGFRAALFHLGVLRRLHETGVLERVATVSSVSGGSILAGFLARRTVECGWASLGTVGDWEDEVAAPFRELCSSDLRTAPVVRHALWSWVVPGPLARAMVRRYRRLVPLELGNLPIRPRFVLLATDVAFGVSWVFTRSHMGDYLAGYARTPPGFPLAFAVAASACFPPLFGPMRVPLEPEAFRRGRYRGEDRGRIMCRLALTDGGVYDNLGLEPALRGHHVAVVSDAGGPFQFVPSRAPLLRYMRYPSLLMNQVAALRKRQLMSLIEEQGGEGAWAEEGPREGGGRPRLRRGVYLGIDSCARGAGAARVGQGHWAGYGEALVRSRIAHVRTDLDRFTRAEQEILENHGYSVASAALERRLPDLLQSPRPVAEPPHPDRLDDAAAERALAASHRRLSLRRLLHLV